jgi:hypothetical protein
MICHFQGGGGTRPRAGARSGQGTAAAHAASEPGALQPHLPPHDPGPLGPLLASLVGREVTLLAGRRLHTGRLLQAVPVTLTDAAGRATIIAAPVISVQF